MDKLILENQVAIMKALDLLLLLTASDRHQAVTFREIVLQARINETKAALETCRPEGLR